MEENNAIQLFEDKQIRTAWDDENEQWYFSVVDVVSILADSTDGRKYWNKLKQRLKDEGNQSVSNCHQLKLKSPKDGKHYLTDVADTEQLLLAGIARKALEVETGKPVITSQNAVQLNDVVTEMIEGVLETEKEDMET